MNHQALKVIENILQTLKKKNISININQLEDLKTHANLLLAWNRKMNLTRIVEPREIANRHFLEGLCAGDQLRRKSLNGPLLDLGSGNGFPAVPMAIAWPGALPVTLVESSEKRGAFLRTLMRELEWKTSQVVIRRIETGRDLAGLPCRIFTSRGVALSGLLEEGLPFLEPGAVAVLFTPRQSASEIWHESLEVEEFRPIRGRENGILLLRK